MSNSPLLFPSPSPPQRQVCALDWCFVGLCEKSCVDCAHSNCDLWMPMACIVPSCEKKVGAADIPTGKNVHIPACVQTRINQSRRRLKHVRDVSVFVQRHQFGLELGINGPSLQYVSQETAVDCHAHLVLAVHAQGLVAPLSNLCGCLPLLDGSIHCHSASTVIRWPMGLLLQIWRSPTQLGAISLSPQESTHLENGPWVPDGRTHRNFNMSSSLISRSCCSFNIQLFNVLVWAVMKTRT